MRVASKTIYETVKFNLANITKQLNKANRVVASGKRITNLSDDPVGLTQTLNIKSSLSHFDQLRRNISMGKSWLTAAESALRHVQDLISDAKTLCVQMATASTGSDERASAAKTVQNMMEEIVSLANTEVNGNYIFAGSKTNTTPFSQDGTYYGDKKAFISKIGKDATVEIGNNGEIVFGALFTSLSDLKDALENNNVSGIREAMSNLDADFNHISEKTSDIGSKMTRMEIKEKILQDLNILHTERLSNIEDADIAEAITDLKEKELAYQAALASSSKVMRLSLVHYL